MHGFERFSSITVFARDLVEIVAAPTPLQCLFQPVSKFGLPECRDSWTVQLTKRAAEGREVLRNFGEIGGASAVLRLVTSSHSAVNLTQCRVNHSSRRGRCFCRD